ncbi:hypothetical protein A9174_24915 [Mesorhizobium loti NZP2037]|nr:DUF4258 domain-containing protein [Mesorhizobium loti]ANN59636.1 hypothetical protein A9174_24915 [Mesorhizobium loti NZP2037]
MAEIIPLTLTAPLALKMIKLLAADTNNIVIVAHARKRGRQRRISRRQVELCVQRGSICEGPIMNAKGHWQVNMYRHAAGEEMECVVAIDWGKSLIVITVF